MGCLIAVFALIWKILKTFIKIVWKVLRLLLFKCGLIFIGVYVLGAFLIELYYKIGLWPGGEMQVWYYIGLGLSAICSAILIIRAATKKDREQARRNAEKDERRRRG